MLVVFTLLCRFLCCSGCGYV